MNTIKLPNGQSMEGRRNGDKFSSIARIIGICVGIIFSAGIAWSSIQANAAGIRANANRSMTIEEKFDKDHDTVIKIRQDVKYIKMAMKDYKHEQAEQRKIQTLILTEVRKGR